MIMNAILHRGRAGGIRLAQTEVTRADQLQLDDSALPDTVGRAAEGACGSVFFM